MLQVREVVSGVSDFSDYPLDGEQIIDLEVRIVEELLEVDVGVVGVAYVVETWLTRNYLKYMV